MRVTLRIPDAIGEGVDEAAIAAGVSRSTWILRAIARELQDGLASVTPAGLPTAPIAPSPRKGVFLRIQERELVDLEKAAQAAGLTRNQWINRAIHAVLYGANGIVRPLPEVRSFCRQMMAAINPIGRNVNQAVRKISTIAGEGFVVGKDLEDLLFQLEQLREMHSELCRACEQVEAGISHLAGGNYRYWTGQ